MTYTDDVFDPTTQVVSTMEGYTSLTGVDTVSVESVAPDVFTPIVLGSGDKITLGRPLPDGTRTLQDIRGTVRPQIYGNGPVAVVVDNSGDTDRHDATFTYDPSSLGAPHVLSGLAPAPIYFILDAASSLLVKAGAGDDSFQFPTVIPPVPLTLDGGGGTNTLDYSTFTSNVLVNLQTDAATGAGGGVVRFSNALGGSGDDVLVGNSAANELRGGMGNDIVVGGNGNDRLFGDAGRDILIGGIGADVLEGGTGDDVLLGGYTHYDTQVAGDGAIRHEIDLPALQAIMLEWATGDSPVLSAQENYKTRISRIRSGGGLNGTSLLSKKTVVDDSAIDSLFGGDELDWFLLNKKQDADDRKAAETETSTTGDKPGPAQE